MHIFFMNHMNRFDQFSNWEEVDTRYQENLGAIELASSVLTCLPQFFCYVKTQLVNNNLVHYFDYTIKLIILD